MMATDSETLAALSGLRPHDDYGPFDYVYAEARILLLDRHKKYGPSNINGAPGGPLNGLLVRMYDKLARIRYAMESGGERDYADESFRDAWLDLANYSLIGVIVQDDKWPK